MTWHLADRSKTVLPGTTIQFWAFINGIGIQIIDSALVANEVVVSLKFWIRCRSYDLTSMGSILLVAPKETKGADFEDQRL